MDEEADAANHYAAVHRNWEDQTQQAAARDRVWDVIRRDISHFVHLFSFSTKERGWPTSSLHIHVLPCDSQVRGKARKGVLES